MSVGQRVRCDRISERSAAYRIHPGFAPVRRFLIHALLGVRLNHIRRLFVHARSECS
jgi:hypothetical protein